MLDRRLLVRLVVPALLLGACRAPGSPDAPPEASPARARLERRLAEIFREDRYQPATFGPVQWEDSGSYLVVEPSASPSGGSDLVRYGVQSGERSVLIPAERLVPPGGTEPLVIEDFALVRRQIHRRNRDGGTVALVYTNTRKVWRQNTRGDYWIVEFPEQDPMAPPLPLGLRKLGGDAPEASLMFAKLSPDGSRVGYVRENELYVEDVASGAVTRLTHDGSPTSINGTSDWVYEEEFDLRDAWRWSPDGLIAFWGFDASGVPLYTLVNTTDSLYPTLKTFPYPKAGQTNSAAKIGVVGASWIELPGDPREHYVPRMEWVNASELMIQQMDRRQQRNTVWLADVSTGEVRELLTDASDAWLDVVDDWQWLPDGSLLWISERDGWRHAWSVTRTGEWRCLTPGAYDVTGVVAVDDKGGSLYFQASPEDPTRRYLFRAPLAGGPAERVTPAGLDGTHTYDVAPHGEFAFHTQTTIDRPARVSLVRLPSHETVRVLEDNAEAAARMAELRTAPTEFFRLEIEPGVVLDGWLMKRADLDPRRTYPLLVYAYNEPSASQVIDNWKGVRGLFHRALAEAGYVVACIDTQGTPAPRGKAWRKSTYQRFAPVGAAQQVAAVRKLCAERPYLDAERVAVWGWSGGGTMTLNLLFRHPGVFRLGMAVAPVPDLALYDSIYQERYTGLPSTDAEAYRLNSPITFAEGLADPLLLVHGSGDDNVHMQGSERLINRLVDLGKPFEFMLYPNRSHAINEGAGTLHHVYSLLARYLWEHLPPG